MQWWNMGRGRGAGGTYIFLINVITFCIITWLNWILLVPHKGKSLSVSRDWWGLVWFHHWLCLYARNIRLLFQIWQNSDSDTGDVNSIFPLDIPNLAFSIFFTGYMFLYISLYHSVNTLRYCLISWYSWCSKSWMWRAMEIDLDHNLHEACDLISNFHWRDKSIISMWSVEETVWLALF